MTFRHFLGGWCLHGSSFFSRKVASRDLMNALYLEAKHTSKISNRNSICSCPSKTISKRNVCEIKSEHFHVRSVIGNLETLNAPPLCSLKLQRETPTLATNPHRLRLSI